MILTVRGFSIINESGRNATVLITVFVNSDGEPRPVRFQKFFSNIGDAPRVSEKIEVEERDGKYWWGDVMECE